MTTATATRIIHWSGLSGRQYEYRIYPLGTNFKAVPGNYIFAKETAQGRHSPIYIGETADLSERFDNHHKCLHPASECDAHPRPPERWRRSGAPAGGA